MKDYIFTSESVTEGHPDKICDQIADAIVDAALAQDPYSNMAVECTIKDDFVLIYGECNTKAELDYETIALNEIKRIGYTEEYHVHTVVNQQSPEIHNAVNRDEVCAGDQGIMFGYACDENDEYMPLTIYYAHLLARQLSKVRRQHPDLLKPDGKTQVSVEYENDEIKRIDTIVVSTQHSKDITQEEIKELIMNEVIKPCIDEKYLDEKSGYFMSKLLDWYNNLDSETKNIVFPTFNNYIYNLIDSNKDLSFKMFTQNIQDSINKGISTNKNYFSELNKDIHILLKKYFDCESSFSFDFISLDDVYELIRNIDLDVKIDEQFIFDLLGTVLVSKNISMVQSIVNKEVNSSNKVFKRSNRDGE